MYIPEIYWEDLVVRMAHHSTAIEGNSLSEGETKSILLDSIIPRMMDEREYHEVANYRNYIKYLKNNYKKPIDLKMIQEIHSLLLKNIRDDACCFKKQRILF